MTWNNVGPMLGGGLLSLMLPVLALEALIRWAWRAGTADEGSRDE